MERCEPGAEVTLDKVARTGLELNVAVRQTAAVAGSGVRQKRVEQSSARLSPNHCPTSQEPYTLNSGFLCSWYVHWKTSPSTSIRQL